MFKQNQRRAERGRSNSAVFIIVVVFAAAAVVGISVFAGLRRSTDAGLATLAASKTERVVVAIEGMSCAGCAAGIKAMLKRTPGVVSAEVSYENKEAVVDFNPAETSREKIIEVINNLGYKASVKE